MKYEIIMIADFQCPYCYLGKSTIDRLKSNYDIEIIFKGYEIHPDIPTGGIASAQYFPNAKQKNVQLQLFGQQHGVEFTDIVTMPNTKKALLVAEYAKLVNKSDAYNDAMYKAFFFEGTNIGLIHEIKRIASAVGITEEEVEHVFIDERYDKLLNENKSFCLEHSITSVPTFIINNEVVIVGAQDTDSFEKVFKQLAEKVT